VALDQAQGGAANFLRNGDAGALFGGLERCGVVSGLLGVVEQPELVATLTAETNPEVDGAPMGAVDERRAFAEQAGRGVGFQGEPELPCRVAGQAQSSTQLGTEDLNAPIGTSPNEWQRARVDSAGSRSFGRGGHGIEGKGRAVITSGCNITTLPR
jgi:hypothetical protein